MFNCIHVISTIIQWSQFHRVQKQKNHYNKTIIRTFEDFGKPKVAMVSFLLYRKFSHLKQEKWQKTKMHFQYAEISNSLITIYKLSRQADLDHSSKQVFLRPSGAAERYVINAAAS